MVKLTAQHSAGVAMIATHYLRVQLARSPEPADPTGPNAPAQMIPECEAQLRKMREAQETHEMAKIERMSINAQLQRLFKKDYQLLVQIAREVRVLCNGNSDSPVYIKVFKNAPYKGAGPGVKYQDHMRYARLVHHCLTVDPTYASLAADAQALEDSMAKIQEAFNKRETLINTEQSAKIDLELTLSDLKDFYNHCYVRLLMAYDGDTDTVNACFYKLNKNTKKKKKTDEDDDDINEKDEDVLEDDDDEV